MNIYSTWNYQKVIGLKLKVTISWTYKSLLCRIKFKSQSKIKYFTYFLHLPVAKKFWTNTCPFSAMREYLKAFGFLPCVLHFTSLDFYYSVWFGHQGRFFVFFVCLNSMFIEALKLYFAKNPQRVLRLYSLSEICAVLKWTKKTILVRELYQFFN